MKNKSSDIKISSQNKICSQNDSTKKSMGFWMCLALVIGNMVASGIFLLPASLAPYGMNSIYGWIFTGTGGFFLAYVFAYLAKVFPQAGGPYVYPERAFGEATGFVVAWGYWLAVCVGNTAIATGTISYFVELVPAVKNTPGAPALATCAIIWILTYVNWRGIRTAGSFLLITTIIKLLPLFAVGGLGVWVFLGKHWELVKVTSQPFTLNAISASATLTLWALLGLESATIPADNVINPQRNIPRATLWGIIITIFIYIAACTTVIALIPTAELAKANAPFAVIAKQFWGENAALLVTVFAFISGFGALAGWIFIQGKMPEVLAQAGIFPKIFARQSKYNTPGASLGITSTLVSFFILLNYNASLVSVFTFLLLISTSACLVMYLFCSLAVLKLTLKKEISLANHNPNTLIVISILAAIYSCWTLYGAGLEAFLLGMSLLAAGFPVYAILKWKKTKHSKASYLSKESN